MLSWTASRGRLQLLRGCAALGLLALLTLGQARLFDRLLYLDPAQYGFVLQNVDAVRNGHPVSKSWQQRFLGPALVVALDPLTHDRLLSLRWFGALAAGAANLCLFTLCRRRSASIPHALCWVLCFVLCQLLFAYKLQYPWDGLDVLLMLGFGYGFGRGHTLSRAWPLLLPGVVNHETILYAPLYQLLSAAEAPRSPRRAGQALLWLAGCGALIYALREHFYQGRPDWPGQAFEAPAPLIENHLHVLHNLQQWLWLDLREGRIFVSLSLTSAVLTLCALLGRPAQRTAALWSLCVLASVVCFGYVNETRHYLLLIAFWFGLGAARYDFAAFRGRSGASYQSSPNSS
jgi:hypothetical protein